MDERDSVFLPLDKSATVRGTRGGVLAKVSPRFYRRLCMEGSGRLADGRVVTYSHRADGQARFQANDTRYGVTCRGTPLIPYRSVAVDRWRVRLGSILYVPAADGLLLEDGTPHDGIFFADDVGGAVRGQKMDFFVGFSSDTRNLFTESRRILHARPVEVFLVPPDLAEELSETHRATAESAAGTHPD